MRIEVTASGQEIYDIITKIEPVIADVPIGHAVIATLTVAASLMRPGLSPDEVQESVSGMSKWLCDHFDAKHGLTETETMPKEKLN